MDPVEVRRLYRDIKIPTKLLIRQPDEKKSKKKKAKAAATAAVTENGSGPDSPSINGRTMEAEVKQYFWAIFCIFQHRESRGKSPIREQFWHYVNIVYIPLS